MRDLIVVLGVVFTTHRVTSLIVASRLLAAPRERFQNWAEGRWVRAPSDTEERRRRADLAGSSDEWQSLRAYLVGCLWCASLYAGGIVTLVTALMVGVPVPFLVWLSASTLTGLLGTREG